MAELGIGITKDTAEDLIKQKFEFPLVKSAEDEDHLLRGEFDVIKELLVKLPGALEAKAKVIILPSEYHLIFKLFRLIASLTCVALNPREQECRICGSASSRPSGSMMWLLRINRWLGDK